MSVEIPPDYFHCYECGARPPHHISVIQNYDCSVCGGRKCFLHGGDGQREEDRCYYCGQAKLCIDCYSLSICCHNYDNVNDILTPIPGKSRAYKAFRIIQNNIMANRIQKSWRKWWYEGRDENGISPFAKYSANELNSCIGEN